MSVEQSFLKRFEQESAAREATRLGAGEQRTFQALDTEFVEIVVPEDVPRIFVVSTRCLDQVREWWMILQPDVLRNDLRRGWQPVDEAFGPFLGCDEGRAFDFRDHDIPQICKVRSLGETGFTITNWTEGPLELIATRSA